MRDLFLPYKPEVKYSAHLEITCLGYILFDVIEILIEDSRANK